MKKNILISIIIVIFLFNLDIVMNSVKSSAYLFFSKIFISTFPFMILSDILFYFNYHEFIKNSFIGKFISRLFNIDSNTSSIIIFSLFTSMPNNSIYIKKLLDNKLISISGANKLLCFTYFPSISFVIGTIGIFMLNSLKIGLFLYLNCIFNNILIGLYLRKEYVSSLDNSFVENDSFLNMLKSSIVKSFNNLYIIFGNLIIFSIMINLISSLFKLDIFLLGFVSIILELTNGINNIVLCDIDLLYKLFFISFGLNFSGLSVLFQSFSILSDYNIDIKKILVIKLIFSIINSLIFILRIPILLQI